MGRRQQLDQCKRYSDYDRFAAQHGCTVETARGGGSHVTIRRDGQLIARHTSHGEPGPHTASALRKALAALLLLAIAACALGYLMLSL